MDKLVSILIPVFNREFLILETINSAISQTYNNIEIIIVDNCSTDNTWNVIKEQSKLDKRIKVYRNKKNLGPVLNWKACLDRAKGEYAKILFSDDLIKENYLVETIKLLDTETAFIMSKIQKFNNEGEYKTISKYNNRVFSTEEYFLDLIIFNKYEFPVSPGCALFRLEELKKALIVDLDNNLNFRKYGAGNDLLLFMNVALGYKYIKTTNNTTSFFRSNSKSFTIANELSDYYNICKHSKY